VTAYPAGRWPELYVVGAGRSGTTALHHFLGLHHHIRVSNHKSPNYFVAHIPQPDWETPAAVAMARHWITTPEEYLALFAGSSGNQVLVDVSPVYLQTTLAAERIAQAAPTARIVAILRDPAERAFAHFLGRRRDGIETTTDFAAWLDHMSPTPLPDETAFGHYVGCGRYHHFLTPYLQRFGSERVLILFYEDLLHDPRTTVNTIIDFAGLEPDPNLPLDSDARPNRSGEIRSPLLRRAWTSTVGLRTTLRPLLPERVRRSVGRRVLADLDREELPPECRARVIDQLAPDIEQLAGLTGRDLQTWLS